MLFPYAPGASGGASEPSRDSVPTQPVPRARAKPGPRRQTSAPVGGDPDGRWLSIEAACKVLGVDQSTLRRWSDSGKIPVYRTPGGHRRYAEDDLRAIMRGEQRPRRRMSRQALTSLSMSGYEHEYLHQAHMRPWYRAYDAQSLDELRPLGRRMVDLTIRYISGRGEREEVLADSRELGRRYGEVSARVGLSTTDALEAFLFFRAPVIQAVTRYIEDENVTTRRAARITAELTHFMDEVLIATIAAHQRAAGG